MKLSIFFCNIQAMQILNKQLKRLNMFDNLA